MQPQDPYSPPIRNKPSFLPLIILGVAVVGISGLAVFVSTQKTQSHSNASYDYPTQAPSTSSGSSTQQSYSNPFDSPTPTYQNPFAQDTSSQQSDTPYQNPFAGGQ